MKKIYLILFTLICSANAFSQIIQDPDADMIFLDENPDKNKANGHGITPSYVIIGNGYNVWNNRIITYFFANGTPDINGALEQDGVRDAFDLWKAETDIAFLEVCNANDADIVISWEPMFHGGHGGSIGSFDGPNGIYAHTLIGNPTTQPLSGNIHFDEEWTLVVRNNDDQPMDLVTIAAHEIGHAIGLGHSNVSTALMAGGHAPYLQNGSHRFLTQDDINGIRSLYGNPGGNILISSPTNGFVCSGGETSLYKTRRPIPSSPGQPHLQICSLHQVVLGTRPF